MTLKDFSKSINEFYEKGHDKPIHDLSSMLSVIRLYILKCYDDIDEAEFATFKGYGATAAVKKTKLKEALVKEIRKLNRWIKASANPKFDFNALKHLNDFFFDDKGNIRDQYMATFLPMHTDLYRMRSAEGYKVYKRKEIFQIAGENRKLTSKLRFSDDGHPCLYLGASLYIAWEEVRRASFDTVNFPVSEIPRSCWCLT